MDVIATKKKKILATESELRKASIIEKESRSRGRSLFKRLVNVIQPTEQARLEFDIQSTRLELRGLEEVARQLFLEVNDLRLEQDRIRMSYTMRGRFWNMIGYFLSAYCIYKIVMASVNLAFEREAKMDPVSRSLELALKHFHIQINVAVWSQYISFVFVGIIMSMSMRGFLRNLMTVYSWTRSLSSSTMVLFLAQVMGMYFLSSVLLIRMSLPATYRRIITQVLGDIKFTFYHRWFDFIFLCSALSMLTIIFFQKRSAITNKLYEDSPAPAPKASWFPAFLF
eukprot:CAMPEP_0196662778 /NCGR_PEP_ID=MMETSP1086-20130531/50257_1 /TAXON_ID=77921 /ORGANISM="Cyanoptyche  gloeocystis , Strain SAG4.97" /LENGTH=282 /DNA_ID=CAMNT_0041998341 /DNA_START=458 /DNA_END=1306 /DNA_ORIENTATION=+